MTLTTDEIIEKYGHRITVVKGYKAGKIIQYRWYISGNADWIDCNNQPLWHWDKVAYRIKPGQSDK